MKIVFFEIEGFNPFLQGTKGEDYYFFQHDFFLFGMDHGSKRLCDQDFFDTIL